MGELIQKRDWFQIGKQLSTTQPQHRAVTSLPGFNLMTEAENVSGYAYPPMGADAEMRSFNYQADYFNRTQAPSEGKARQIIHRMEEFYDKARFELPYDFLEDSHLDRIITLVMLRLSDKSPGSKFLRMGLGTNGEVFDKFGLLGLRAQLRAAVDAMLSVKVDEDKDPDDVWMELRDVKKHPACDHLRCFVKFEGHKRDKLEAGRFRLIFGTGLIDQLLDRLLYQNAADVAITNHMHIPSKIGFNPKKGGVNKLVQVYDDGSDEWLSFDKKANDWTVSGYNHDINARLVARLNTTQGPTRSKWCKMHYLRVEQIKYGAIVFSNGLVLEKTIAGILPSGWFLTAYWNSMIVVQERVSYDIHHHLTSVGKSTICMGDDSVQNLKGIVPADFVRFQKETNGVTYTLESDKGRLCEQNFCSFQIKAVSKGFFVPIPLNWEKNAFHLWNAEKPNDEKLANTLNSLCIEYAYSPSHFDRLYGLLREKYPAQTKSTAFYKDIVTGFESA